MGHAKDPQDIKAIKTKTNAVIPVATPTGCDIPKIAHHQNPMIMISGIRIIEIMQTVLSAALDVGVFISDQFPLMQIVLSYIGDS